MTNDFIVAYSALRKNNSHRKTCELLGVAESTVRGWLKEHQAEAGPRVTLIDIETAPHLAWCFGRWDQNLGQDNIEKEGFILSVAHKKLYDPKIEGKIITDVDKLLHGDDREILEYMLDVYENTDILVGQNIKRFDHAVFRARLCAQGMPPPKPVKLIDTKLIAKSMKFPSNSLDSLLSYLGLGRKTKNDGISLWIRAIKGEQVALDEMLKYNKDDVSDLEDVWLMLRPFDNQSPDLGSYFGDEKERCISCGSEKVKERQDFVYGTGGTRYSMYECLDCGKKMRYHKADKYSPKTKFRNAS